MGSKTLRLWLILLPALALLIPILFAGLLSSTSQAAVWSSVSQSDTSRRHIVRPGESLFIIAQNYGFELHELAELNNISNPSNLMVGQTIYLPDSSTEYVEPGFQTTRPAGPPVQALDATAFPPSRSRPDEEEYFRLQQWMGGQKQTTDIESIDYNYVRKTPQPEVRVGFDIPLEAEASSKEQDSPESAIEQVKSIEAASKALLEELEEEVKDSDSPALAVFGDRPYSFYGSGEDLLEALQNFAASYYVPIVISEDVIGEVNGKIGPLTPVDFLDHMANIYGFIWYFDGHSLYIYSGSSAEQKIISLEYMSTRDFKKTLKKVGVWDGRFFWKEQPKDGLIYVSGPPRYIEIVGQTAELLDDKEGERQKSKLTVRMFRLKYAWATDKSFNFRGQQIVVPGVASLLRNIVSGGGVSSVERKPVEPLAMQPAKGVVRSGTQNKQQSRQPEEALNAGAYIEGAYISADPRLNAIIVHDLESKMVMYEGLIESLDKPSSQVEVSVSIIDVNTADIEALGVDWNNTRGTNSEITFDPGSSAYDDDFSSFTTVLGMNIGSFNARLSLLEDEGRAKVVSKPSILTLDNLEAVFDNSSTFYVQVASQEDAELFPVTSGTVVQVTPRIVKEEIGRRIHMSVNIQDGGDTNDQNLSLPRVSNSSISTQAIVNENESLLIGGFYKESQDQKTTKVPLLGDIPVLGRLFRADKKQNISQMRLFLITPRILGAGA
ncbi:type III secretion system outer membrane ring subunit SctC [Endozoicomonas sp. 8E]|uniref:type III secretion system outer membrane ring subunit SctC n=1 Tax=Endozoicomonas sp. 8E TaxID=3035692 RepID=UPI002938F1EC|nr:type III secretion system outer membrane ring subunit SctC [Endozoicomonas sp. 8E]WOG29336.1 type III secretion system outer membrane ring subunit SctC [Endozoicomonas sp. 8E]